MLTLVLFFILAFLTVAALIWAAMTLFREREDPLADRLKELQAHSIATATREPVRRRGGFLGGFLNFIGQVPGGDGWLKDIEKQLAHAGVRQPSSAGVYALCQVSFLLLLCGVMAYLQRKNDLFSLAAGMTSALLLGWLLPRQVLHYLVRRYQRKLQEALPDTADLLGVVLGAGLALDQAMLRVSEEMEFIYPEIASEFAMVVMQVKAGQERAKAFRQLVRRTGIEDIKALSAMIVQSERFGASLSQTLRVYAESLRTRRRLRAETAVAKAGIKMLFPIVIFILPALFIVTLAPGILSVLRDLSQGLGPSR
jgi:tight adherence protein C